MGLGSLGCWDSITHNWWIRTRFNDDNGGGPTNVLPYRVIGLAYCAATVPEDTVPIVVNNGTPRLDSLPASLGIVDEGNEVNLEVSVGDLSWDMEGDWHFDGVTVTIDWGDGTALESRPVVAYVDYDPFSWDTGPHNATRSFSHH